MGSAIRKYAKSIKEGKMKIIYFYEGGGKGTIIDPSSPHIPLDILEFGIYDLKEGPFHRETKEREVVLVPQEGYFKIKVGRKVFEGERKDGPFPKKWGRNNACAIYVGKESEYIVEGDGEVIFYTAPALKKLPPLFVPPGSKPNVSRGVYVWRRDVVTLVEAGKETSNLSVGETYSSPGLWSGTPIHTHDRDDPEGKETDHEEVYYHLSRLTEGEIASYPIQLFIYPEEEIWEAFIVKNKTIVVLPGGCHPVVASPVSDILYGWGMANFGKSPILYDLPEFLFLRKFESFFRKFPGKVSFSQLEKWAEENALSPKEKIFLTFMLKEQNRIISD